MTFGYSYGNILFMNPFNKIKETKKEVKEKMLTLILAGFGIVFISSHLRKISEKTE